MAQELYYLDRETYLILFAIILWILPWKGLALWPAARNSQKWWFIILLIISDFGILEIAYVFLLKNTKPKEAVRKI